MANDVAQDIVDNQQLLTMLQQLWQALHDKKAQNDVLQEKVTRLWNTLTPHGGVSNTENRLVDNNVERWDKTMIESTLITIEPMENPRHNPAQYPLDK